MVLAEELVHAVLEVQRGKLGAVGCKAWLVVPGLSNPEPLAAVVAVGDTGHSCPCVVLG